MTARTQILGSELQTGHVIEVWWSPRQDFVTRIDRVAPYFGERRIAQFASGHAMTIYDNDRLTALAHVPALAGAA